MYGTISFLILFIGLLVQTLLFRNNIFKGDYVLLVFIIASAFFLIYDLAMQFPKRAKQVIVIISLIRFIILLWNVYARNIVLLPGVGTDTEGFYQSAVFISQFPQFLDAPIYGDYYAKYLGIIYYFTGPSYLLGSYLNFVYGLESIKIINNILKDIPSLDKRAYFMGILLFSVSPINMILCSSLRRESIMILFTAISLRKLFQWINTGKNNYAILSVAFLLLASIIHAGIIGFLVGYAFLFIFYRPERRLYQFDIYTIGAAVLVISLLVFVIIENSSLFLNKLMFTDEDVLYNKMSRAVGGAAYLTSLSINNLRDVFLYSPIKVVYFLFSPFPWDWRGIPDVIAFLMDSLIYVYFLTELIIYYKNSRYPSKFGLLLVFAGSLIIYAMGSQNAANAMRHRCKLLAVLVILFCIVKSNKEVTGRC